MAEPATSRRGTFGPVVLLGLAAGTLAAVAGNEPWAHGSGSGASRFSTLAMSGDAEKMPAAGALALVVLACWGVILVTRGRARRAVAGLALLASAGLVAAVAIGVSSVPAGLRSSYAEFGLTGLEVTLTGWFWASCAAAALSLAATVLAVLLVPGWPEMGSRYDAPGAGGPTPASAPEDQTSLDLWRALDEGRDPTA